jgi:hypothetical protein
MYEKIVVKFEFFILRFGFNTTNLIKKVGKDEF